jgi:PadR family transcriptional regulator PadR
VISKELAGASTRPILLSILSRADSYGYAIIQDVKELSRGTMDWKEGMLYPVLHRLEDEKLIESFWKTPDSGRKRKYYRILPAGREALETEKQNWFSVNAMFVRLWGPEASLSLTI